jgi:O-antigen ligase
VRAAVKASLLDLLQRQGLKPYDADRFTAQRSGLSMAVAHPLGIGPGRFLEVVGYDAHSLYVRTLVENGWLGLGALVGWLGAAAAGLWRLRAAWGPQDGGEPLLPTAALLAILGGLAVQSLVIDTVHWRHLWRVMAMAVSRGAEGLGAGRAARSPSAERCPAGSSNPVAGTGWAATPDRAPAGGQGAPVVLRGGGA